MNVCLEHLFPQLQTSEGVGWAVQKDASVKLLGTCWRYSEVVATQRILVRSPRAAPHITAYLDIGQKWAKMVLK